MVLPVMVVYKNQLLEEDINVWYVLIMIYVKIVKKKLIIAIQWWEWLKEIKVVKYKVFVQVFWIHRSKVVFHKLSKMNKYHFHQKFKMRNKIMIKFFNMIKN